MATKQIWLNLPVKDVSASKKFYNALGFKLNPKHPSSDSSACYFIGETNFVVMLFEEETFKSFTNSPVTDTSKSAEMLISFDAENKEEVDEIAKKVVNAGGVLFSEPSTIQDWMYGCGFTDLDGHRWNVLYMDLDNAPKTYK